MLRKKLQKKFFKIGAFLLLSSVLYSVSSTAQQTFLLSKQPKLAKENLFRFPPSLKLGAWLNFDFSWSGIGRFILNVFTEFFGAPIKLIIELFHLVTLNYFKKKLPVYDTSGGQKVLERRAQFNVSAGQGTRVTGGFLRGTFSSSNQPARNVL